MARIIWTMQNFLKDFLLFHVVFSISYEIRTSLSMNLNYLVRCWSAPCQTLFKISDSETMIYLT